MGDIELTKQDLLVEIANLKKEFVANEKSLIENEIDLTSIIEKNRTRIASMWSFPQLNDGFKVIQEEKKIYFGKRYINLPALILFNKENLIDEIIFDFHYAYVRFEGQ